MLRLRRRSFPSDSTHFRSDFETRSFSTPLNWYWGEGFGVYGVGGGVSLLRTLVEEKMWSNSSVQKANFSGF